MWGLTYLAYKEILSCPLMEVLEHVPLAQSLSAAKRIACVLPRNNQSQGKTGI